MTEGASEQGLGVGGISRRAASWSHGLCVRSQSSHSPRLHPYGPHPAAGYPYLLLLALLDGNRDGLFSDRGDHRLRLPNQPIGWICCAIGFIAAVDHFAGEYAVYAVLARSEALPGSQAMLWLQSWLWMLFVGLLVFLLLLFPTGRLPSSRWRPFAWVSVAMISVAVIWSSIISPDVRPHAPPSPVQLSNALGLVAAASVVVGRRGARGVERQQIKWLLYAGAIFFVGPTFQISVSYVARVEGSWALWVGSFLGVVSGLGVPVAIGFAILRHPSTT